jgi:catalase
MQTQIFNGSVNFGPSSQGGPTAAPLQGVPYKPFVQGNVTREKIYKTDDFSQAKERYLSMNETEKERLAGNLIADLIHVTKPEIQKRALGNLAQVDEGLAATVAKGLGL